MGHHPLLTDDLAELLSQFPNEALQDLRAILASSWSFSPLPSKRAEAVYVLPEDADLRDHAAEIAEEVAWWGRTTSSCASVDAIEKRRAILRDHIEADTKQAVFVFRSWGGRRPRAGRPTAAGRRRAPHRTRVRHDRHVPAHVTLRGAAGLPSFRDAPVFLAVCRALAASSSSGFRLLHFSVQADHLHLLVEADGHAALTRAARVSWCEWREPSIACSDVTVPCGAIGSTHGTSRHRPRSGGPSPMCFRTSESMCRGRRGSIRAHPRPGLTAGRLRGRASLGFLRCVRLERGWRGWAGCGVKAASPSTRVRGAHGEDITQMVLIATCGAREHRDCLPAGERAPLPSERSPSGAVSCPRGQLRQGSTRIFACSSGLARSRNACATPSTPTRPVTSGATSMRPSAMAASVSMNSPGV